MSWDQIYNTLTEINIISVIFRLVLGILCGGIVGLERGMKGRPAGFRTYILVCTGAVMVMMTNQYVFQTYGVSDPVRMGAQVINGIGFLGAGTIIVTRQNQVKGLTTAAALWACACTGLAIGMGFYSGALAGTFFIFITIIGLDSIARKAQAKAKVLSAYIEFEQDGRISNFFRFVINQGMRVENIEIIEKKKGNRGKLVVSATMQMDHAQDHNEIIAVISELPDIAYIHVMN